jgi:hypothetical protein
MHTFRSATASDEAARSNLLPRTYFVGGHRVEQQRNASGHPFWVCDCPDFARARQCGGEHWCEHAERVAAAAELDRLMKTPRLILSPKSY